MDSNGALDRPLLHRRVPAHTHDHILPGPSHAIDALLVGLRDADPAARLLDAPDKDVGVQSPADRSLAGVVPVDARDAARVRGPSRGDGVRVVGFVDEDFARGEADGEVLVCGGGEGEGGDL